MPQIVVVDDDPLLRDTITLMLEEAGHSVLRCENGKKAIDFLAHGDADLLITDILMPEMDGIETLREAKRMQPALPILAISGGGIGDARHYLGMAKALGATAVLRKPFGVREFVELVSALLVEATVERGHSI